MPHTTKRLQLQLYDTKVGVLLLALCVVSGYRQLKNLQTCFSGRKAAVCMKLLTPLPLLVITQNRWHQNCLSGLVV